MAEESSHSSASAMVDSCGCSYRLEMDFTIYKIPCSEHAPACSNCAGDGCAECDGSGQDFSPQQESELE